jgi:transcriptional regulator with XRE-family HTH domain
MANALKISTNAYYQLESGRSGYSMSMLKLLGSEFNISLNYLLLSNGLIFLNNIQIIENEILVDMSQETTPVSQKDMLKMIQDLQKKVSEIMKSK